MKKIFTYFSFMLISTILVYAAYAKDKISTGNGGFTAMCSNNTNIVIACQPPSTDSLYSCTGTGGRLGWGQSFAEAVDKVCQ